jgi:polyisoprenoid-binding protein YceI
MLAISTVLAPQAKTFSVGDQPQRMSAKFESVTEYETFLGTTNKITGSISYDPSTKAGSGKLVIDASTIKTGVDLRDEHMRSANWLDTAKYPTIEFETTQVKAKSGDTYTVTGNLKLHGVTKKVTTAVEFRYLAASAATKANGFKGDVVRLTANFNLKLSDYGIKVPEQLSGKVANQVAISIKAFGTTGA